MIIISKFDNSGCKQTLLDVSGYPINFPTRNLAKTFLKNLGFTSKEINSFNYEYVEETELDNNYKISNYEIRTIK